MKRLKHNFCFGGEVYFYEMESKFCDSTMRFSIFFPPKYKKEPCDILFFLSGLTCTEENFMMKAGAQKFAAKNNFVLVAPDTSPRNTGIIGEDSSYDLGSGASFYIDAQMAPWAKHYQMESFLVKELIPSIEKTFGRFASRAISGNSMGGHGALTLGLKYPELFSSISAFSPICNPANSPWGRNAFSHYLGANENEWKNHDASHLIAQSNSNLPILVSQGLNDEYIETELFPRRLLNCAKANNYPLTLNFYERYDHSFYFIASFIEEHLNFHKSFSPTFSNS